jgi:hypothetical protein
MAIKREDYDFDEDELSNETLTMTFEDEDVEEVVEENGMTFERLKDFHMNAIENIAGGLIVISALIIYLPFMLLITAGVMLYEMFRK